MLLCPRLFSDFGDYLHLSVMCRYVAIHKCTVKGNTSKVNMAEFKISFSRISNRKILSKPAVEKLGLAFSSKLNKSQSLSGKGQQRLKCFFTAVCSFFHLNCQTSLWETGSLYIIYILGIIATERFPVYFPSRDPSSGTADPALTSTFI